MSIAFIAAIVKVIDTTESEIENDKNYFSQ